jgi:hypothetical protein
MSGNALPPASPSAIGGRVDADDIVALRLTGPYIGMVLINNPNDSDFVSAFTLGEIQTVALPPIEVDITIAGLAVTVDILGGGGPIVAGHWTRIEWDDGSPDRVLSWLQSSATRTYAAAGDYLIRITNSNGLISHHPVTVA